MRSIGETEAMENGHQTLETASVTLLEGMRFAGEAGGRRVDLDVPAEYGGGDGAQPMQLLLLALAGCTAMDVLSVLRKKRQRVTGLEVEARGRQALRPPRTFDRVEIVYRVRGEGVDAGAVGRAIELSRDRYCPVIATVRPTAELLTSYEVGEDAPAETGVQEEGG